MRILTSNQRRVDAALRRAGEALTVAEIASRTGLTASSTRTALMALDRYGAATVAGSALSGGQTWATS